jgi:hypothetical protein
MARYNTAPQTLVVTGEQTFTYAFTGGIISLTGTAGYTVTMVSPVFFPGSRQTFYNATDGMITLTTAAGQITGNGVTIGSTIEIPTNSTYVMTSDGANYVLTSALAGTTVFELPVTFNDLLNADGKVELNPLDNNVEIKPTGSGTVDISPQSSVSIQPGATATIRPTGDLILTSASGTVTLGDAGKTTSFPGNISFITDGQAVNISPTGTGSVTIDPGGNATIGAGGTLTISSDTEGTISNMSIGATNPSTGAFTSLTAPTITATSSGASTSTSSGALIVSGGMGVGGAIYAGSLQGAPIGSVSRSTAAFTTLTADDSVTFTKNTASTNTTSGTLVVTGGIGASGAIYAGSIQNTPIGNTSRSSGAFTTLTANSTVTVTATTASTSVNTGAFQVDGGVGINGALWAGSLQGTPVGSTTRSTGAFTTLTANSTVTFSPNNANVTLSPSGTGTTTLSPAGGGSINNMSIGATTRSTAQFTSLNTNSTYTSSGQVLITNTTASTSINTGALQVDGGIGANGTIWGGAFATAGNISGAGITGSSLSVTGDSNAGGSFLMDGVVWLDTNKNITSVKSIGVNTAASNVAGEIRATNQITAFYSDARLKNFEGTIDNALSKVMTLNGYYYTENETAKSLGYDNNERQVGVSAQEVMAIMPEVVKDAPINFTEGVPEGADYKTVQYEKLVPLLIEAIKELKREINILKGDN